MIKTLSSPTWQYKGLKLPLLSLLVLLFPLFFLGLQVQNQLNNQIWSIATSEFFNFLKTAGIYACIFSAKFWLHVSLSLQMAQPVWKQTAATISLRRQWRDSSASLCYSDKGNKGWIWTFVYDGKSSSDGRISTWVKHRIHWGHTSKRNHTEILSLFAISQKYEQWCTCCRRISIPLLPCYVDLMQKCTFYIEWKKQLPRLWFSC